MSSAAPSPTFASAFLCSAGQPFSKRSPATCFTSSPARPANSEASCAASPPPCSTRPSIRTPSARGFSGPWRLVPTPTAPDETQHNPPKPYAILVPNRSRMDGLVEAAGGVGPEVFDAGLHAELGVLDAAADATVLTLGPLAVDHEPHAVL